MGVTLDELIQRASELPDPIQFNSSRLVVHIQTSPQAITDFLDLVKALAEEKRAAGFVKPERSNVNGSDNIYREVFVRKGRNMT